jgi:TPR repeat protein
LEAGVDKHTCDAAGRELLHIAAEEGHTDILKCLVKVGVQIDTPDKQGNTVLHIAATSNNCNMVRYLIQAGANLEKLDANGDSPIYLSAKQRCIENIRNLLVAGATFVPLRLRANEPALASVAVAQDALGLAYEEEANYGPKAKENSQIAAKWTRLAAENGNAEAQYRLTQYLRNGRMGFSIDNVDAMKWLKMAAVGGHTSALKQLEECETLKEIETAIVGKEQKARTQPGESANECEADDREVLELVCKLETMLTAALANILLNEKIPLDIEDSKSGETLIPANMKITMPLLRGLAKHYDCIYIDSSPIARTVQEIISPFSKILGDAYSVLQTYRLRTLQKTPAYDLLIELKQRADGGDAVAQHELGVSYYTGTPFIEKDIEKAKALFRSAAGLGHIPSLAALGDCHSSHNERYEALQCYRQAAKHGDAHGQFRMFQFDTEGNAVLYLRSAAEQGHAEAQRELAHQYTNSDGGAEDRSDAAKWYRLAAEQGDAEAQRRLGECYVQGWIVSENSRENIESYWNKQAVKWYREAAEKGDLEAQKRLARCYAAGVGVAQNETQAAKWYGRAGDSGAYEELGDLYARMGNKTKARKYYRKAGFNGWSPQIRALGPKSTW